MPCAGLMPEDLRLGDLHEMLELWKSCSAAPPRITGGAPGRHGDPIGTLSRPPSGLRADAHLPPPARRLTHRALQIFPDGAHSTAAAASRPSSRASRRGCARDPGQGCALAVSRRGRGIGHGFALGVLESSSRRWSGPHHPCLPAGMHLTEARGSAGGPGGGTVVGAAAVHLYGAGPRRRILPYGVAFIVVATFQAGKRPPTWTVGLRLLLLGPDRQHSRGGGLGWSRTSGLRGAGRERARAARRADLVATSFEINSTAILAIQSRAEPRRAPGTAAHRPGGRRRAPPSSRPF